MTGWTLAWAVLVAVVLLTVQAFSVLISRALRTYSRSYLEDLTASQGRPERAQKIAHIDEKLERATDSLAALAGLVLATLIGVVGDRVAPGFAAGGGVLVALAVVGIVHFLAGVIGRVYAETTLDFLYPTTPAILIFATPFLMASRAAEAVAGKLSGDEDARSRPVSVEVELPQDSEDGESPETEIPDSAREVMEQVAALTRTDVSELMTPRSSITALPASATARQAAKVFEETGRSRIPMFGASRDDILGILFAKDLFPAIQESGSPDQVAPRKLLRQAYFVPETKNAWGLLAEFRSERTQIAVVLDEYGGVAGLVTFEDIIEALVGPIDDEHDVPSPDNPVVIIDDRRFEVDASLELESLNERLGLNLPTDGDAETVGGFAFNTLGRLPEPGATFETDGVTITVLEVVEHAIRRIRLELK